jgi:ankyrin repeat protein
MDNTDVNESLCYAAEIGDLKNVLFYLDKGADISYQRNEALRFASDNGHTKVVKLLLLNGGIPDSESLYFACSKGHLEIVKALLTAGCPSIVTTRAFIISISLDNIEIVKQLLKHTTLVIVIDIDTKLLMKTACKNSTLEMVKLLFNTGLFELSTECIENQWDSVQETKVKEFIEEKLGITLEK